MLCICGYCFAIGCHYSSQTLVVCPDTEVERGVFLDCHAQRLVRVAHAARTASPSVTTPSVLVGGGSAAGAEAAFLQPWEAHRAAAASELAAYVDRSFNAAGVGSVPWARGAAVLFATSPAEGAPAHHHHYHHGQHARVDPHKLVVVTTGCVHNSPNFWAGSWAARYEVALEAGPTDGATAAAPSSSGDSGPVAPLAAASITTGRVRVTTHYYEGGNVQADEEFEVAARAIPAFTDSASFGVVLARCIASIETGLANALDAAYTDLSTGLLKDARRALPV